MYGRGGLLDNASCTNLYLKVCCDGQPLTAITEHGDNQRSHPSVVALHIGLSFSMIVVVWAILDVISCSEPMFDMMLEPT